MAGSRISRQPGLLSHVKEAIAKTSLSRTSTRVEYDMGRPIGYDFVVQTTGADTVVYAKQVGENVFTRFVKAGKPSATHILSMIFRFDSPDVFELTDVWIGPLTPPRPGSSEESASSKTFWSNHAYLLDAQTFQKNSLTKDCPY